MNEVSCMVRSIEGGVGVKWGKKDKRDWAHLSGKAEDLNAHYVTVQTQRRGVRRLEFWIGPDKLKKQAGEGHRHL
ncbi:unnamed protein product [Arctogadus glacialis]